MSTHVRSSYSFDLVSILSSIRAHQVLYEVIELYVLLIYSRDFFLFFAILGRGPGAFQIVKISVITPKLGNLL